MEAILHYNPEDDKFYVYIGETYYADAKEFSDAMEFFKAAAAEVYYHKKMGKWPLAAEVIGHMRRFK